MPNHNWSSMSTRSQSPQVSQLLDITSQLFLEQCISEPTRQKNILDLVFASPDTIRYVSVEKTALSDHNIIYVNTYIPVDQGSVTHAMNPVKSVFEELNFYKANWENIKAEMSRIDWNLSLSHLNSSQCFEKVIHIVQSICVKCVPKKSSGKKTKKQQVLQK